MVIIPSLFVLIFAEDQREFCNLMFNIQIYYSDNLYNYFSLKMPMRKSNLDQVSYFEQEDLITALVKFKCIFCTTITTQCTFQSSP